MTGSSMVIGMQSTTHYAQNLVTGKKPMLYMSSQEFSVNITEMLPVNKRITSLD